MKRKKTLLYVMITIVVLILFVAFYIYREYNRTAKDTAELGADYTLEATGLITEFTRDESASNNKYWNKIIKVTGAIKEVNRDEMGLFTVLLGNPESMSSVRCTIDSTHSDQAAVLRTGEQAAIKGICSGFNADELLGSDVILVRCAVDKK